MLHWNLTSENTIVAYTEKKNTIMHRTICYAQTVRLKRNHKLYIYKNVDFSYSCTSSLYSAVRASSDGETATYCINKKKITSIKKNFRVRVLEMYVSVLCLIFPFVYCLSFMCIIK